MTVGHLKNIIMMIIVCCLIFVAGCDKLMSISEQEEGKNTPIKDLPEIKQVSFTHNGTDFEIIPFYEVVLEYIKQVREQGVEKNNEIYTNTVFYDLNSALAHTGSSYHFTEILLTPSKQIDTLEEYVHLLMERQDYFNELIMEALEQSTAILPSRIPKKILLFPFLPDQKAYSETMNGAQGFASAEDIFVVFIDPVSVSPLFLKYIVAHEYHHTVYFEDPDKKWMTLLGRIIFEGKADHFASMIYPEAQPHWTHGLDAKSEELVWRIIASYPDAYPQLPRESIFNGEVMQTPNSAVYKIGFQIMQDYFKHYPDAAVEDWTLMDERDIVQQSKFRERFSQSPYPTLSATGEKLESHAFTYNQSEFHMIPLYKEIIDYIKIAWEYSDEDRLNLYQSMLLDPFHLENDSFKLYSMHGYYDQEIENFFSNLIESHDEMISVVTETLKKAVDTLPRSDEIKVYLLPLNPEETGYNQQVQGVEGFVIDKSTIVIQIDPRYFKANRLHYVVARDYHGAIQYGHTIRDGQSLTLLEDVLIKGKANTFARTLYPELSYAYLEPLNNEEHVWNLIQRNAAKTIEEVTIDFKNGARQMQIPRAADQNIGFQILQDFINNHPNVSVEEWTRLSAKDLLEKSRYEERFN